MTGLEGIRGATGLSTEETATLDELMDVSERVRGRNCLLDDYYAAEHVPEQIGVSAVPETVHVGARCDWAAKAVTSVAERVRMDGFDADEEATTAVGAIEASNRLSALFNRHIASELVHGCMFMTVNRAPLGPARVRVHTAETSSALWDEAAGRLRAGVVVADWARTHWSPDRPVPVQANMHLPGAVVVLRRSGPAEWSAERLATLVDRPLMEAFCFRPTGLAPLGQTRITKTVRYLVDAVTRTLEDMAVSAAFYSAPQKWMSGLTDEQYDKLVGSKWQTYIGSILLATRDDGGAPTMGQFPAVSPQPYVEQIMAYGKLFAGATGVPLNSLGIVQDNPSSADAIESSREDICVAAEDCIESNREAMRNVALMSMAVSEGKPLDALTDSQRSVAPHFRDPMRASLSANADAMTKIASVLPGFEQTDVFLESMRLTKAEAKMVRDQMEMAAGKSALRGIMAKGSAPGGE